MIRNLLFALLLSSGLAYGAGGTPATKLVSPSGTIFLDVGTGTLVMAGTPGFSSATYVLTTDGTKATFQPSGGSGGGGITSLVAASPLLGGTIVTTGTISLPANLITINSTPPDSSVVSAWVNATNTASGLVALDSGGALTINTPAITTAVVGLAAIRTSDNALGTIVIGSGLTLTTGTLTAGGFSPPYTPASDGITLFNNFEGNPIIQIDSSGNPLIQGWTSGGTVSGASLDMTAAELMARDGNSSVDFGYRKLDGVNGHAVFDWALDAVFDLTPSGLYSANFSTRELCDTSGVPISGLIKQAGDGWEAAVAGTDYQIPISLTTDGSSGAATFNPSTGALNIPVYSGGGGTGTITLTGPVTGTGTTTIATSITHDATLAVTTGTLGIDLAHANTWGGTQTGNFTGTFTGQSTGTFTGQSTGTFTGQGTGTWTGPVTGTATFATNAGAVGSGTYLPFLTVGVPSQATSAQVAAVLTGGTGTLNLSGYTLSLASAQIPNNAANTSGTSLNVTGTVVVANGGTGDTSLTAYAPLFGGTTSTGAVQSGTVGTSGQVLTSNGAGALPTFQTVAAGGTVTLAAMTMPGVIFNTSVTGSPITTTGTFTPTLATQTANTVLAGPTTGSVATPTFRALVSADIPNNAASTSNSAASLSISGQTGLMTVTGLTSTNRIKTVRDAADTILELGGSYTPTGNWTSLTMVTPVLGTPTSGTLTNCTGLPISTGVSGLGTGMAAALAIAPGGNSGLATLTAGGVLTTSQSPAFTGDVTKSAGSLATTVTALNGTALSGLASGLVYNTTTTGAPSKATADQVGTALSGTTVTVNLGSSTLTLPATVLGTNAHNVIGLTDLPSAVNYANISNSATGVAPIIAATGSDTNLNLSLAAKGTGAVLVSDGSSSGVGLKFATENASYGWWKTSNGAWGYGTGGSVLFNLINTGLSMASNMPLDWSSTTGASSATKDTGLSRGAAGVVNVNGGVYTAASAYGQIQAGTGVFQVLGVAGAPTLTTSGTAGSTSNTYGVVAKQADGTTSGIGATATITTANATLSGTNKVNISWTAVTGATSYDVYLTATTGAATLGKVQGGVTTTSTTHIINSAGDGTTPPATNLTGLATIGGLASTLVKVSASGVTQPTVAGTDYSIITVQTGTLVGGTATKTVPSGCHPWVQDNQSAGSLTNVGNLTVTVSGTTATITSTNPLDVSPFSLFNAGSQ